MSWGSIHRILGNQERSHYVIILTHQFSVGFRWQQRRLPAGHCHMAGEQRPWTSWAPAASAGAQSLASASCRGDGPSKRSSDGPLAASQELLGRGEPCLLFVAPAPEDGVFLQLLIALWRMLPSWFCSNGLSRTVVTNLWYSISPDEIPPGNLSLNSHRNMSCELLELHSYFTDEETEATRH